MNYNFDQVTAILDSWLSDQLGQTKEVNLGRNDRVKINASLLQLENWLIDWQRQRKINQRVNAAIMSQSILDNVHSTSATHAFSAVYYQLNFLHFLALHYQPKTELHDYIDQFVETYKDQVSLADIVITDTGATRVKTNIRFALNTLRDIGFVESKDLKGKRSFRPTIPGITVLLNMLHEPERLSKEVTPFKIPAFIKPLREAIIMKHMAVDPTLHASLQMFDEEAHFYTFIDTLALNSIHREMKSAFRNLMQQYIDFTNESIVITPDGLRFTKDFKKKAKVFQEKYSKQSAENEPLFSNLLEHYRQLHIQF